MIDPRRATLVLLAALAAPLAASTAQSPSAGATPASASTAAPVAPMGWSAHPLTQFRDDELDLPYYLQHFSRLANAVRMEGADRGFIDLSVWRAPQDNRPYNARIMENLTSLAYFYSTDRPWNPYHGDPAVRARLEAALDFWVRSQSPEGRFSEYGPGQWNLAATAFATKFMGETLRLLRHAPPVDSALIRRVAEADRRAIVAVLESDDLYRQGRFFSNQYSNVWAGALAYLDLYPDAALRRRLEARIRQAAPDHQSPVGYFYEADGPDWSYNLNTHHSNLLMAWAYARGTPLGDELIAETARWYDWWALNAVPEPDGSGYVMNRAIETRQQAAFVDHAGPEDAVEGFALAERVPLARLLGPTREQSASRAVRRRAELAARWPRTDTLALGQFRAYAPYAFLHRAHPRWLPADAERRAAFARLPYIVRDRFIHQRVDTRRAVAYTFIRTPAYYAAFNSGELWREQQRYGLGLLWTRSAGALLQSQTGTADAAWGTRSASGAQVYEARSFTPVFRVNGAVVEARPGNRDLPAGTVAVEYPLSTFGQKRIEFGERAIRVTVRHVEPFIEQLPLLVMPGDELRQAPGAVEVWRGATRVMAVRWSGGAAARVARGERRVGGKEVAVVAIPASGELRYAVEVGAGG